MCTCMDNAIQNNMCKHIHEVASRLPVPVEEPPKSNDESLSVIHFEYNIQDKLSIKEALVTEI